MAKTTRKSKSPVAGDKTDQSKKLRESLLEKYFPFRPLDKLTRREIENFDLSIWRNVELMNSDLSCFSDDDAKMEFLEFCRESIRLGFEIHYEKSHSQSERAKKKDAPARKHARELAQEFRKANPHARIGNAAFAVASEFNREKLKSYTDHTIRKWIADLFPAELRKPGRPPK